MNNMNNQSQSPIQAIAFTLHNQKFFIISNGIFKLTIEPENPQNTKGKSSVAKILNNMLNQNINEFNMYRWLNDNIPTSKTYTLNQ